MLSSSRDSHPRHRVTLVCFDAPVEIVAELEALSATLSITDILEHPWMLWELIAYHLSTFIDEEVINLSKCFTTERRVRL